MHRAARNLRRLTNQGLAPYDLWSCANLGGRSFWARLLLLGDDDFGQLANVFVFRCVTFPLDRSYEGSLD